MDWTPYSWSEIVRTTLNLKVLVHIDLLNPINFSWGEIGHPVAQNCSVPPLEQDAKSTPEVGNSLPLKLPRVPSQRAAQLLHLLLCAWVPATQRLSH